MCIINSVFGLHYITLHYTSIALLTQNIVLFAQLSMCPATVWVSNSIRVSKLLCRAARNDAE